MFTGKGDLVEFVAEWDKVFSALQNAYVIQANSMSGFASMRILNGKWEIELGS